MALYGIIVTCFSVWIGYVVCGKESGCLEISKFDYEFQLMKKIVQMEADKKEIDSVLGNFETSLSSFRTKMENFEEMTSAFTSKMEILDSLQEKFFLKEGSVDEFKAPASTFTRWGRSECPDTNSSLVYSGYVGGSDYAQTGAASNYLCLTKEPTWHEKITGGSQTYIYGAEYEFSGYSSFGAHLYNHEPPCAVCTSPRPTVIMIPGRNVCYDGWTMEYIGYLVAGHHGQSAATEFICLDITARAAEDSGAGNNNGKLMYLVRAACGSLHCPPYKNDWTVTCVVCSK